MLINFISTHHFEFLILCWTRQTFFASCLNLVDLFVCGLCVLALAFHRALGDAWASLGAAALVIRYTAQFCRLAIVVFQCVHYPRSV